MIGSEINSDLSVSTNILKLILNREVPVETNIRLNWIDVKDVAEGCYLSAQHGHAGERYILANEKSMPIRDTTKLAQQLFPKQKIGLPVAVPKPILYAMGAIMEGVSRLTNSAPLLTRKDIAMFSGLLQDFDITKSKAQLGFNPKPPQLALTDAMHYMMHHANKFGIKLQSA